MTRAEAIRILHAKQIGAVIMGKREKKERKGLIHYATIGANKLRDRMVHYALEERAPLAALTLDDILGSQFDQEILQMLHAATDIVHPEQIYWQGLRFKITGHPATLHLDNVRRFIPALDVMEFAADHPVIKYLYAVDRMRGQWGDVTELLARMGWLSEKAIVAEWPPIKVLASLGGMTNPLQDKGMRTVPGMFKVLIRNAGELIMGAAMLPEVPDFARAGGATLSLRREYETYYIGNLS